MQRCAIITMFLLFGTLFVTMPVAFAEEEDITITEDVEPEAEEYEDEEEDYEVLAPHVDIKTAVYFPDGEGTAYLGEIITVLVSFFNTGDDAFNVTNVGASLHSPYDYSYYIQNFSEVEYGTIVGPEQQLTLEYRFRPDPSLEPVDFLLSGYVTYNDSGYDSFRSFFYNGTLELADKPIEVTPSLIFGYSVVSVLVGSVAYVALSLSGVLSSASKKVARVTGTAVKGGKDDAAWGTDVYNPKNKSKAANKKSKGKKKKQ